MHNEDILMTLLKQLKLLREERNITYEEIDEQLTLGPGWTEKFETGEIIPSIDILLAMLDIFNVTPQDFFNQLPKGQRVRVRRSRFLYAEADSDDVIIKFHYNDYNAQYRLRQATIEQYNQVLQELRSGLAHIDNNCAVQTDTIAHTFFRAVRFWPHLNPSDIWWFLVYRAYCDPYNHPALNARRDFGQSWKRAAGWALERIVVRHYGHFLESQGVKLLIPDATTKQELIGQLDVQERLESDKVDIFLVGTRDGENVCFGVVHVKSSIAERRTDDVPMSQVLMRAGYTSPLWTMDCKSLPSHNPENRGELGMTLDDGEDRRSAKRKDIEDDGYFSACFSYNSNTIPTPTKQNARARIHVCSFNNPDDAFSQFILAEWKRFNH